MIPGGRRAVLPALLAVAAVVVALHWDVLALGRVYYERDVHLQWIGQMEVLAAALADGRVPGWDPLVSFGQPLLANPNVQVFYPPTWIGILLPPGRAYTLLVVGHTLFGAWGMFRLARCWGISRAGSTLAAAAWAAGPVVSLVDLWNHLCGAAFLPWILLRGEERDRPVAWAAVLAGPVLAGSPDFALVGWGLAAARALTRGRGAIRAFAMAALLAGALSAVQWVPALAVAAQAGRLGLAAVDRDYWSIHPASLVQALAPLPTDARLQTDLRVRLFEGREPLLRSLYLGLTCLALAALGLRGGRLPRRFLAAAALVGVVLSLGSFSPMHATLGAIFPPLRALRFPAKLFVLTATVVPLLAGAGLDGWRRVSPVAGWVGMGVGILGLFAGAWPGAWAPFVFEGPDPVVRGGAEDVRWALAAAGFTLAAASLVRRRPGAVAALAVLDLVLAHRHANPTAPPELYQYRSPILRSIQADGGSRVFAYNYPAIVEGADRHLGRPWAYRIPAPPGPDYRWMEAAAMRTYLFPPIPAAWGLRGSFAQDLLRLRPAEETRLFDLLHEVEGTPAHAGLLRRAAVTHLVALHDVPGLERVECERGPFPEPIHLYRVPGAEPRVRAVGSAWPLAAEPTWAALADGRLPAETVAVPETAAPAEGPEGALTMVSDRPDVVAADVEVPGGGYLVVRQAFDPGWSARVDDRPAPVVRADLVFCGVPVPPGRHRVELRYWPPGLTAGAAATLVALAGALLGMRSRR